MQHNYGSCNIVFDGYNICGTTKDQEHQRRTAGKKTSANIHVKSINIAHGDQEAFLCNENNKAQFVSLLAKRLFQSGNKVLICEEDADTKIAEIAIAIAKQNKTVTVM